MMPKKSFELSVEEQEAFLRDQMAGRALNGFMASRAFIPITKESAAQIAAYSYAVADAMLKERAKVK